MLHPVFTARSLWSVCSGKSCCRPSSHEFSLPTFCPPSFVVVTPLSSFSFDEFALSGVASQFQEDSSFAIRFSERDNSFCDSS